MAKMIMELPDDLIKQFNELEQNTEQMMGEMTTEGAKVVHKLVSRNIKRAFKNSDEIMKHCKITKVYHTPTDQCINTKVGFFGYLPTKDGKAWTRKNKKGKSYTTNKGIAVSFIVIQREYGNSRGEKKVPFFRPSFNYSEIEKAMREVEEDYIHE